MQFGSVEKIEDKPPASELTRGGDGKSYEPAGIGTKPNTYLGIIQFTDQGMLKKEKQLLDTTAFIKTKLNDGPLVLMIFVHGWNHNASPSDGNLRQFRRVLLSLPDIRKGNILGVYLGWPGNVRLLPIVSYFSRLNSAQRVGRLTCTEVMLSLLAEAKTIGQGDKTVARKEVKTIVIGHSMGGLIVERAFLQAMIGYGLTNAATSDQVESLKRTQETAASKHRADQKTREGILEQKEKEFRSAEENERDAAARLDVCKATEKEFMDKKELSRAILGNNYEEFVKLKERAKGLQKELLDFEQSHSLSDSQRSIIRKLAEWLYHERRNEPDSAHHALDGLIAWSHAPEKAIGDSESLYRKSAELYAIELPKETPKGTEVPAELKAIWQEFTSQVGDAFGIAELRKGLEQFLGLSIVKREEVNSDLVTIGPAVRVFDASWREYKKAKEELSNFKSDADYVEAENAVAAAIGETRSKRDGVIKARNDVLLSTTAANEAEGLSAKLDIVRSRPPADLIMLLNPASDAVMAEQMRQVWLPDRGGARLRKMWPGKKTPPWIVSISSDYDLATRLAYPFGMAISQFFRGVASPAERVWMTHTPPHIENMQTHALGGTKKTLWLKDLRKDKGMPETPLWVVSADKSTNPEHNVSTENFVRLIPFFLTKTKVLKNSEETRIKSESISSQ